MKIHIELPALEYIKRKSQKLIITLDVVERPGGACSCSGGQTPYYPSVRVGLPKNIENYEQTNVEGITIYTRQTLPSLFSGINIKIEKLLFIKSLVALGEK